MYALPQHGPTYHSLENVLIWIHSFNSYYSYLYIDHRIT
nr:MAG TPA: hypothetical protein [Crassvirales sp.]